MNSKTFSLSDRITLREVHNDFISKRRVKEVIKKLEPDSLMSYEAQEYYNALQDVLKELGLENEE